MTKLINGDSLRRRIKNLSVQVNNIDMITAMSTIDYMIGNQPTIDAIPVSFIEKKIESIRQYLKEHEGEAFTSGLISKAIAYERLIEEWREENETD